MMSRKSRLISWIVVLTLASIACGSLKVGIVSPTTMSDKVTDQTSVDSTQQNFLAPESYPAPEIKDTIIPTESPSIDLPAPLYFWMGTNSNANQRIAWRLDPGESRARMVTPMDTTAFSIWPEDGRLVYANQTGELYIELPDEEPRRIYEVGKWMGYDLEINSLAWSPDGTRLAYSVDIVCMDSCHFENPDLIAQPTGVWILKLKDESHTQVLRNIYLDMKLTNLNETRTVKKITWAPDGEALLLFTNHWEWQDVYWLYPLAFEENEDNLHDPEGMGWLNAAWGYDGQTTLLSGMSNSSWSDLIQVDKRSMVQEVLIHGTSHEPGGVYVSNAQELTTGIVFFMVPANETGSRLYLGSQSGGKFNYTAAGPNRDICNDFPTEVAWDASENLAVVACNEATVRLISLDGSIDLDLTPYLSTILTEVDSTYGLQIFWGAAE